MDEINWITKYCLTNEIENIIFSLRDFIKAIETRNVNDGDVRDAAERI